MEDDSKFMRLAIALAKQAEKEGEVPVGAILVRCDEIVASGKVPAQRLLDQYYGDWGGDVSHAYKDSF